nr:caspase family protein [Kibdelosporangium phytohabitans]
MIGTAQYQDPDLTALPSVAGNLIDLAAALTDPRGAGLRPEHCLVLRDPPAQADVGDQIVTAASEAEDVLLVYYSGHGLMTWGRTSELCLALRDTRSKSLQTSALRCADLRQYILDSPARTRVLILDCCFAGRGIEPTMSSAADTMLGEVDVAGAFVLAAAQGKALAPLGEQNTLFTGELLRLLREGIPSEPGMLLTLHVLFREVRAVMRRNGWPEPRGNSSDMAAHLALGHNPAHLVRKAMDALRGDITRLRAEEAQTRQVHDTVRDKIREPNLSPLTEVADRLVDRLDELERYAATGRSVSRELAELKGQLTDGRNETRRLRVQGDGLLDRRAELRERLKGYQAQAVRLRIAEEWDVAELYVKARTLLWTKPCDLVLALRAVNAYQQAVTNLREKRR